MSARLFLPALVACCAACAAAPQRAPAATPPAAPPGAPTVSLQATLAGDTIDVTLVLPLDWIPRSAPLVSLEFAELPFRDGQRGFADFLALVGDDGAESPWPTQLPWDKTLRVRYRVKLKHHLAGPSRGLDEVPHPTAGGWVLSGRAFVPIGIRLEDGRHLDVAGRLAIAASGSPVLASTALAAESFSELANAMYVVGAARTEIVEVGAAKVTVVTSDFSAAELRVAAELVRRALALDTKLLGEIPSSERTVLFDRNAAGGIDGMVLGRAVSVLSEMPPRVEASFDAGVVTVHELAHLWNRAPEWWMNEGFTRYVELISRLRLDGATEARALVELAPILERYLDEAGRTSIGAGKGPWGYASGAVVALCTDIHLRAQGQDFFSVHRAARSAYKKGDRNTIDAATFFATLTERSPETATYAKAIVPSKSVVDLADCLGRAGYALEITPYAKSPRPRFDAEILGVRSRSSYSTEIFSAPPASVFRAGDVLVALGSTRLERMADVELAIDKLAAGSALQFSVRRAGQLIPLTRTMPQRDAAKQVPAVHVRITPKDGKRGTKASPFL